MRQASQRDSTSSHSSLSSEIKSRNYDITYVIRQQ